MGKPVVLESSVCYTCPATMAVFYIDSNLHHYVRANLRATVSFGGKEQNCVPAYRLN